MSQWKSGTQYILCTGPGQSNGPFCGQGSTPIPLTAPNTYCYSYDGNLKPFSAAEPVSQITNIRYPFPNTNILNYGYASGFFNRLNERKFQTNSDSFIFTGLNIVSTTTTSWAPTTTAPPNVGERFGVWQIRLYDLIRNLPNPKWLCLLPDIGESNARDLATYNLWEPSWTTEIDAMISLMNGLAPWAKSGLRILMRILPDLPAVSFSQWSPPQSPNLQDSQIAWAAARNVSAPNSVAWYKPPAGLSYTAADNLHYASVNGLDIIGPGLADVFLQSI